MRILSSSLCSSLPLTCSIKTTQHFPDGVAFFSKLGHDRYEFLPLPLQCGLLPPLRGLLSPQRFLQFHPQLIDVKGVEFRLVAKGGVWTVKGIWMILSTKSMLAVGRPCGVDGGGGGRNGGI